MARRTDHSRDQLSDLILEESRKIIENKGIPALTARNIAAAIGYSPGTLYNLFDNIDDIILHLNGKTLGDLYDRLSEQEKYGSARERLDQTLTVYLHFTQTSRQRWDLLFEHPYRDHQQLPGWYQERVDALLDLFADILRSTLPGCGEKEIKHSAQVLWCGLLGISSLAGENRLAGIHTHSVDEMVRSLVYNYLSGLKRAG